MSLSDKSHSQLTTGRKNKKLKKSHNEPDNAQENVKLQQEIIKLKELNKFVKAKLEIPDVTTKRHETAPKPVAGHELLKDVIAEHCQSNALQKASLSSTLERLAITSMPTTYKEKVQEQLEELRKTNEHIKEYGDQTQMTNEIKELTQRFLTLTNDYEKELTSERRRINEEMSSKKNDAYQKRLKDAQRRLNKMNFMRVVIHQLLLGSNVDLSVHKDLKTIIQDTRTSYSFESFKK